MCLGVFESCGSVEEDRKLGVVVIVLVHRQEALQGLTACGRSRAVRDMHRGQGDICCLVSAQS